MTLTVTDSAGATGSITQPVTVSVAAPTIGFRAVTRSINNSTTSTVTVPTAVRADDALLLFATINATDTVVTPPAGWTQAANFVTSSQRTLVWQRVATATDPGRAITVGLNSTTKIVLQLAAYSGTSTTNPVGALLTRSETVRTTSHPTPPATVTGDGRWIVSYWADKSSTTTDWIPPAGATPRDEAIGSGSGRIATLLADSGHPGALRHLARTHSDHQRRDPSRHHHPRPQPELTPRPPGGHRRCYRGTEPKQRLRAGKVRLPDRQKPSGHRVPALR